MKRIVTVIFIVIFSAVLYGHALVTPAHAAPVAKLAVAGIVESNPVVDRSDPAHPKFTCPDHTTRVSGAFGGDGKCLGDADNNPIYSLLNILIRFLSGMVGVVIVLILVIGGFQYIISNGSPEDTKSAKNRLKAAVTGLVLYVVMIGALQLILPPHAKLFGP